ncbi:MAG: SH3 domain-containing protein [Candidatus Woesebacteria bacterium]
MLRRWFVLCLVVILAGLAIGSKQSVFAQNNPGVDQPNDIYVWENSCNSQMTYRVHGLAANSPIRVDVHRNSQQCDGSGSASAGDSYNLGNTDGNGNFGWVVVMTDWGDTQYTFTDGTGNQAFASFHYENGSFSGWSSSGNSVPVGNPVIPTDIPPGPDNSQPTLDPDVVQPTLDPNLPTSEFPEVVPTLVDGATLEPTEEPTVPYVGYDAQPTIDWVRIEIEVTNVRSGPGKSDQLIAKARQGMYFTYLGVYGDWVQIGWSDGSGWILYTEDRVTSGDAATAIPPTNVPPAIEPTVVQPVSVEPTVVPTLAPVGPKYPNAQLGGFGNNGVQTIIYCQDIGFDTSQHSDNSNSAHTFRCVRNQDVWNFVWAQVCEDVWGVGYYPTLSSADDITGWRCVQDPNAYIAPSGGYYPDAKTADGGIDTNKLCIHWSYNGSQHSDSGADVAYTIRCIRGQEVLYLDKGLWEKACYEVYGNGWYAFLNSADELGGWKCVQDPNARVDQPNGVPPNPPTAVPVVQPTAVPPIQPGPNGCPPPMAARLQKNGQARTTVSLNVHKQNLNGSIANELVGTLPVGSVVNVVNGPVCAQSMNWWFISSGTILGLASEGQSNVYYLEPYTTPSQPPVQPETKTFDLTYQPWGHTYHIVLNTRTCAIVNGSEVVANELSRFSYWYKSSTASGIWNYFSVNSGGLEHFRHYLEGILTKDSGCMTVHYEVGKYNVMDMSGLGNIVFGFFAQRYMSQLAEDMIADIDQARNENSLGWMGDFDDDRTQRDTGRYVSEIVGSQASVTPGIVETAAQAKNLF